MARLVLLRRCQRCCSSGCALTINVALACVAVATPLCFAFTCILSGCVCCFLYCSSIHTRSYECTCTSCRCHDAHADGHRAFSWASGQARLVPSSDVALVIGTGSSPMFNASPMLMRPRWILPVCSGFLESRIILEFRMFLLTSAFLLLFYSRRSPLTLPPSISDRGERHWTQTEATGRIHRRILFSLLPPLHLFLLSGLATTLHAALLLALCMQLLSVVLVWQSHLRCVLRTSKVVPWLVHFMIHLTSSG